MSPSVSLIVNTFQRTFEMVLSPEYFASIQSQNQFHFDEVVLLINNVDDPEIVHARADDLVATGVVSAYFDVGDVLPRALQALHLTEGYLGSSPHFSDHLLIEPFVVTSDYYVHWDADVSLEESSNWITPSVALLEREERVFIVSPQQHIRESCQWAKKTDEFLFDYTFSDQLFLTRRSQMLEPIYDQWCPASLRFPVAHQTIVLEQHLESHIRNHRLWHAFYTGATFTHEGVKWYWPKGPRETIKFVRNRIFARILRYQPFTRNPRWKI